MKKVRIDIIKARPYPTAVVQIGKNPQPLADKMIIYTEIKEVKEGDNKIKIREIVIELRKKAQKWARKEKIPYVVNLDPDPYPLGKKRGS